MTSWFADPLAGGIDPYPVASLALTVPVRLLPSRSFSWLWSSPLLALPSHDSPWVSSSTMCRQLTASDRFPGTGFFFAGGGNQTLTLRLLTRELTCPADCFAFFSRRFLRWLFVEPPALHLAEDAFPLHLLFQRPESLVDIVVADEYLQEMVPSACSKTRHVELADRVDEDGCANYAAWALRQRSSTIARP